MVRRRQVKDGGGTRLPRQRPKRNWHSARAVVVLGLLVQVVTLTGAMVDLLTR